VGGQAGEIIPVEGDGEGCAGEVNRGGGGVGAKNRKGKGEGERSSEETWAQSGRWWRMRKG